MIPFQERKKLRKILYAKATLGVLFVAFIVVSRGAWRMYQKASIARAERAEAEQSLTDLAERAEGLKESIARLKSERGVEEEIRQKFTVVRPGEEVVVVVDESGKKGKNGGALDSQSTLREKIVQFFSW